MKNNPTRTQEMKIGGQTIKYELADTPEKTRLGLSFRENIAENWGMLFVFPQKSMRTFWMHEMRIPLDMIWITEEKIVQIDKNVPIKTNGAWTMVNSGFPIDKVLEMKAGEADRLGIKEGDRVEL